MTEIELNRPPMSKAQMEMRWNRPGMVSSTCRVIWKDDGPRSGSMAPFKTSLKTSKDKRKCKSS
jgi:hypothetical protein